MDRDRGGDLGDGLEPEARHEARRAQHAQRVVREGLLGGQWRAQPVRGEVGETVEGVDELEVGSRRAMAFTVKSRRDRSTSTESPKETSGLRESGTYTSARCVVISKTRPSFLRPTVPKRLPWSHNASAHPFTSRSTSSGSASVVRSTSCFSGAASPAKASRTEPPTA